MAENLKRDVMIRPNETIGLIPDIKNFRLGAVERKLYATLLLISQEMGDLDEYKYPLGEICALCGVSYTNTKRFQDHLVNLKAFTVKYNARTTESAKFKALGLVKEIGTNEDLRPGGKAFLIWSLPDIVKEKLLHPDGFYTRISLRMATRLSSGSSISLYEIALSYASNDYGEGGISAKYEIQDFIKRILGENLTKEYEWRFFKRDIFAHALKEVNEISDLTLDFREFRTGKRITHVQLVVQKNEKISEPLSQVEHVLTSRLTDLGIQTQAAQNLVKKSKGQLDKLSTQIEITSKAKKVRNPLAYIKAGLQEDYQPILPQINQEPPKPPPLPEDVPLMSADIMERRSKVWSDFLTFDPIRQKELTATWLENTDSVIKGSHRLSGLNGPITKNSFIDFLLLTNL